MKNYILIILMLLAFKANAQEPIKALKVGDKVPESFWLQEHTIYQNGKTTKQNLSAYKGKLLILDFWATWCSPCLEMMPKLDSLQKKFPIVQILSVSYMQANLINNFVAKSSVFGAEFSSVTNDQLLRKYFPHITLPHYVWINANGIISAFTDKEELTELGIRMALKDKVDFKIKDEQPIKYDRNKLLAFQGLDQYNSKVDVLSSLTKYNINLPAVFLTKLNDNSAGYRATYINHSLAALYTLAYANKGNFKGKRMIINVEDKVPFTFPNKISERNDWMEKYTYCYELFLSNALNKTPNEFYANIQDDLKRYFNQYTATIEIRKITCLALMKTGNTTLLKAQDRSGASLRKVTAFGFKASNINMIKLVQPLSTLYLQKHPYPVIDNTGYLEPFDMEFEADMTNVNSINAGLLRYGLQLKEAELEIEVLVISDRKLNKL